MTSLTSLRTSACVATLSLLATPGFADVTPEEVWQNWRSYIAATGYEISATETREGDTLQISDLTMAATVPEDDSKITLTMGAFGLVDQGDGTVAITVPAALPMDVQIDNADEDDVGFGMTYGSTGLSIIASGSVDEMTYTYAADELALTVDELTVDGQTADFSQIGAARMTLADVAGTSTSSGGALQKMAQSFTSGALTYLVDIIDPEDAKFRLKLEGGAAGLGMNLTSAIPLDTDYNDMSASLAEGLDVQAQVSLTDSTMDLEVAEDSGVTQASHAAASTRFNMDMDADGLTYGLGSTKADVSAAGGDLPLPVQFSLAEAAFDLTMPLEAREEEQPFALGVTLADLAVSEVLWAVADPTGQLPHDPATVSFKLDGMAQVLIDMLDPTSVAQLDIGDDAPAELRQVSLSDLVIRAAGAELTGAGAFTFDNMRELFGMPAPKGALDLKLVGGNGLLDNLEKMGVVPTNQASLARVMMGLFARAGAGPDTLTSKIEVTKDGAVLANGQRIQ